MGFSRIASSLLCFALVISLAGCGVGATPQATAVPQQASSSPPSATPAMAALATPAATANAATASAALAPTPRSTATPAASATAKTTPTAAGASASSVATALAKNDTPHPTEASYSVNTASATHLTLKGIAIEVKGQGVTVKASTATITAAGTYVLQGSLDGQIIVDTKDKQPVRVVLNGANLTNASSAPIYVRNAKEVVIILADGSTNRVSDGASYAIDDGSSDEPNAAIFSTADLTIAGSGLLTVVGNYNDGIASKDGLVIVGGTINVTAADDGIRGKDYLVVKDGRITINAKGDGLKADNADDPTRGYILVEKGSLDVTSGGDGLAAETDVLIAGGTLAITSGGGFKARISPDLSAKGIKGLVSVVVDGGTFTIDSADDALHSNDSIVINGGAFVLSTGDDGVHADASVTINGGTIRIANSYEGIEGAVITINGGDIHLVSSDDGVNVSGGKDSSGMMPMPGFGGRPGRGGPMQDTFANTGSQFLYINGGRLVVDAAGDGIDANGTIIMTDGVVIVNGPTQQMNGALDHAGFTMTGGFLVAVGSSGMAQAPGATSTQNALLLNFTTTLKAGTLIHIQSSDGKGILTFAPGKQVQSIAFSSPALAKGATYDVYYGGSSTGTAEDGLYQGGTYTGGTKYTTFTVSSVVTMIGARGR